MKKLIISRLFFVVCLLISTCAWADLEIIVKPSPDWGPVSDADVEYLCQEIVDCFEEYLRPENQIDQAVNVYRTTRGHSFVTLDINDAKAKYKIGVQLRDDMELKKVKEFWTFIIRFGHEFTHILQVEQEGLTWKATFNPNSWFQEVIAELGCVWVMKKMADRWLYGSRFGRGIHTPEGLAEFSENFDFYAGWYMDLHPYDGTGKEWLAENEDSLRAEFERTGGSDMDTVRELYPKLMPVFEKNPEAWNAVRKMPATKGKMSAYMQDWYDAVDVQDRKYVEAIAREMGISVESAETDMLVIDADVNDDGYVDLSDVMIVRSGMTNKSTYDTDVNDDGTTNILDLLLVKAKAVEAIAAASPRKREINITTWGSVKRR